MLRQSTVDSGRRGVYNNFAKLNMIMPKQMMREICITRRTVHRLRELFININGMLFIKTGFLGNGTHCAEPPRFDADFLLVSRGLSAIRVSLSAGKANSRPVFMSNVSIHAHTVCRAVLMHC